MYIDDINAFLQSSAQQSIKLKQGFLTLALSPCLYCSVQVTHVIIIKCDSIGHWSRVHGSLSLTLNLFKFQLINQGREQHVKCTFCYSRFTIALQLRLHYLSASHSHLVLSSFSECNQTSKQIYIQNPNENQHIFMILVFSLGLGQIKPRRKSVLKTVHGLLLLQFIYHIIVSASDFSSFLRRKGSRLGVCDTYKIASVAVVLHSNYSQEKGEEKPMIAILWMTLCPRTSPSIPSDLSTFSLLASYFPSSCVCVSSPPSAICGTRIERIMRTKQN